MISTIYGASFRTGGEMKVFGLDPLTDSREIKTRVGVVTQDNCLDEAMSVIENMKVFASFVGVPKNERENRVNELLDFMSLKHKRHSRIKALSGGMQRRLVFVRALLGNPELVILDEPTTGLDPAVRHLIWDKINELKKNSTTIVLTTHYMEEAERLCDRLVIMDQGKIAAVGSPKELIQKYCPGCVASFELNEDLYRQVDQICQADSQIHLFEDVSGIGLRAASIERLTEISEQLQSEPKIIRPSNLEDVFLSVTGRELSSNA